MSAATALALTKLAGTSLEVFGTYQAGRRQDMLSRYNDKILRQNALWAIQKADIEEKRFRKAAGKIPSAQRVAYAASGVRADVGSAKTVIEQTIADIELDAALIRWGGGVEATKLANRAAIARWEGKQARRAGGISGLASLLSGGAGAYSTYLSLTG